ncbi:hypothetical protein [Caulobacter hibisci]|uniref:Uncharacterized protein n=1 Tax=Caulobacter hibisci TaxID=2035993 RepID=A0ABS0ST03_9CAUL|nr:hypothetical protein [Caulobacter hibisci]MBI1682336.1 hypothetical protein [Caulobacter hibisci]
MKIAPHHIAGTPEAALSAALGTHVDYHPMCGWPDDCMVQWGHGIIPSTPFFEAFPAGTFIRGEGETIEAAERQAFAKWEADRNCDHRWGRARSAGNTYTNGAGWCRRCGAFRSSMFAPVVTFGAHRKPLGKSESWLLSSMETDADMNARMDARYPAERGRRAKQKRILQIRRKLFGERSDKWF